MSQIEHIGMFTTVDALDDPGAFIGLLDGIQGAPDIQGIRTDLLSRLDLQPGRTVLDLGCGTGDHTREIAALVAPGGRVTGVDFSHTMIGEATIRQAGRAVPATFEQGDAQKLVFPDDTFDVCRTERMLCHVPDHEAALREMVRVVKPGGLVGVLDVDLAGVMIDHGDRELSDAFVATMADTIQHPWIGRTLRRLMGEVGLVDVDVRAHVLECPYSAVERMIDAHVALMVHAGQPEDAVRAWRRGLEDAELGGTFFMAMTMFVGVGCKP